MRKRVCVLLVLAVCLGLGAPALADGGVELPDAARFLSGWLEDHGVTVELLTQDGFGTMIGIEDVQDVQAVLDKTRDGLDLMFQLNNFEQVYSLDRWPEVQMGEYLYAYTGSASVGTLEDSPDGVEGSACFYLTVSDQVDGIAVLIMTADGISMKSSGTETAPETVSETAPESVADNVLPDAWAFFNEEMTHADKLVTNGTSVSFLFDGGSGPACYEYMDLLQSGRFGVTLTETWEQSLGGGKTVYYLFDYPGAGEDAEVTDRLDGRDRSADLIVQINDWVGRGWCDLFIRFSNVLTVADTGDRCTITGLREWKYTHSTGPMGSAVAESGGSDPSPGKERDDDKDDIPYTPYKTETKCYKCRGDGKVECSRCDGDGGKWIYDSVPDYDGDGKTTVKTWESCSKCHGSGEMTCPDCGGSGKD